MPVPVLVPPAAVPTVLVSLAQSAQARAAQAARAAQQAAGTTDPSMSAGLARLNQLPPQMQAAIPPPHPKSADKQHARAQAAAARVAAQQQVRGPDTHPYYGHGQVQSQIQQQWQQQQAQQQQAQQKAQQQLQQLLQQQGPPSAASAQGNGAQAVSCQNT